MNDHEPTHSPDSPILDVEHLRDVCGGDLAFEREIIGDFLAQVTPLQEKLALAVASGNANTVSFAAHAIKGSSRSLGAVALGEACAELEEIGDQGDLTEAPAALKRIVAELARLRVRIQEHLDGLAA